jgi:hypothetical protein
MGDLARRHGMDPDTPVTFDRDRITMGVAEEQGARSAAGSRERVFLIREPELEQLLFEAAGAGTRPLLEDHPDYEFPAERVRDAVEVYLRMTQTELADFSSIPVEVYPPVPTRIVRRFAMLQFLELHGYAHEAAWHHLPEAVRDGMEQRAERTLRHLWPSLVQFFSIPEVLCLVPAPPSDADIYQIAMTLFAATAVGGEVCGPEEFEKLTEETRQRYLLQAKAALMQMAWRHGRRAQRPLDELDPEDAKMILSVLDGNTDRRALQDLGTLTKLISRAAEVS